MLGPVLIRRMEVYNIILQHSRLDLVTVVDSHYATE